MARFPRTEPEVIALSQAMVSGLTGDVCDLVRVVRVAGAAGVFGVCNWIERGDNQNR